MRRSIGVAVVALVILAGAVVPRLVGGNKPAASPAVEYDFGGKVLVCHIRKGPFAADVGSVYMTKVQVRRLGDHHFLAWHAPKEGNPPDPTVSLINGATVWTPLSEVVQLVEFDTWEAAKKMGEAMQKRGATMKANAPQTPPEKLPSRPRD